MAMLLEDQHKNYELFRDFLSTALIEKATQPEPKARRRAKSKKVTESTASRPTSENSLKDAEDLADFVEYIAAETFESLPGELKTLDYYAYSKDVDLQDRYALPFTGADVGALIPSLDPSITESLQTYGITHEDRQGIDEFLAPVLTAFMTSISKPPPAPSSTKKTVTALVKRGWHREEDLQNVAWLCGACHRFVHHFASHEELARYYYTVDLLLEQDEIVQFAKWVGRLRWKGQ
ncbi:uncharacterized protein JN550_009553 [Neoarthrinium moseri]|uniref:uncharacterized protein n=1 Tax=Neoarthrinium moseri TaxID=1658444 RepID=UPI001FDD69D4|nr:uncharacterized protein JN550_009553 [Neoarthrinium moseri]KAI1863442.1 hypothetical protein JN550_009553 [Neoarthrinium moseri]